MKKFWGAEVKPGEPLMVTPEDKIIHISQASLDCVKGKLMGETVVLSVNVDGTKLVIGTLSQDKFPQISFDLAFEKNFELSHNCTKASVHFMGYKSHNIDHDESEEVKPDDESEEVKPESDDDESYDDDDSEKRMEVDYISGSDEEEEVPAAVPAAVAANGNAGAAASTVVKADSKPKAKPEEVKPESDDDESEEVKPESDDDESHDDDDSEKGMDEDDSTDERTSDEDIFEPLFHSTKIVATNLNLCTTMEDVMRFFERLSQPRHVLKLINVNDKNRNFLCKMAVVDFPNPAEATKALKLNLESMNGQPVKVMRQRKTEMLTIFVYGFGFQVFERDIKDQLFQKFSSSGRILSIFLPKNINGGLLSSAYIFIDQEGIENPTNKLGYSKDTFLLGGDTIYCWPANVKLNVCKTKFVYGRGSSDDFSYLKKKHYLYFKELPRFASTMCHGWKDQERETGQERETQIIFSLKSKRHLIADPVKQTDPDCWAHALSRGHRAAVLSASSDITPLTREAIRKGVDARYQIGGGLGHFEHLKPFMQQHGTEMIIHHRPTGEDYDEYEKFEENIISLLVEGGVPLAVQIDCFPSFSYFEGKGVYSANVIDFVRAAHEVLSRHALVLWGHGVEILGEERREFWEFQDSQGADFGDEGFIKMARHQCVIRRVFVLKV